MRFDIFNQSKSDPNDEPVYSEVRRFVEVSENELQALAYAVDTHPERNDDTVRVIARMIAEWMAGGRTPTGKE